MYTELEAVTESLAETIGESVRAKNKLEKVQPGFQLAPLTGKGANESDSTVSTLVAPAVGKLSLPPPETKDKPNPDDKIKGNPSTSSELTGQF